MLGEVFDEVWACCRVSISDGEAETEAEKCACATIVLGLAADQHSYPNKSSALRRGSSASRSPAGRDTIAA